MANEFEELQSIPYVFGVVNGSHISIIAPPIDPTFTIVKRGFIQIYNKVWLMQNVSFGTMIFGWVGRYHD